MIQQRVVLSLDPPVLLPLTTQKSRYLRIFAKGSMLLTNPTPSSVITICAVSVIVTAVAMTGCTGDDRGDSRQWQIQLPSREAPEWPIAVFRRAEELLQQGDRNDAISHYRDLIDYSTQFPERSSSIVGIALWRMLLYADSTEIHPELVFKIADDLLRARGNVRRFLNGDLQYTGTGLSEFQMQIWYALASIAWEEKNQDRPRAVLYLYGSGAYISPRAYELQDKIQSSLKRNSLTQPEREKMDRLSKLYGFDGIKFYGGQTVNIALWTGHHLTRLRRFSVAVSFLRDALESDDPRTRTRAGMRLAAIGPRVGMSKDEIIGLLDSAIDNATLADDRIAIQRALIRRALVYDREPDRNFNQSIADLQRVIKEFSTSRYASRALYLSARWYEWKNEYETAKNYYQKATAHIDDQGHYNWRESAYFRASLMRYVDGDLQGAISELERLGELFAQRTDRSIVSPYYLGRLYWLGRMYGEVGRKRESKKLLERLTEKTPFDFYAIRGRMYLELGPESSGLAWPDVTTEESLRNAYQSSSSTSLEFRSQDHRYQRLLWSLQTGLYGEVFRSSQSLLVNGTVQSNGRDPYYLSEAKLLVPLIVWHSLRHDAFVSKELLNSVNSRVHVANELADAGDSTTGLTLLAYHGTDLQHPGYLAAFYPPAFREEIRAATTGSTSVPAELLYGIMREESRFSRGATSPTGARGLFQFQPETFFDLDERWGLLEAVPGIDMEGYLTDRELSVNLGAHWFEHILGKRENDIALSIMEHHAGPDRVNQWFSLVGGWNQGGRFQNDLELKIEMARQPATRIFTRGVMTSMWISKASGMFGMSSHD